MTGVMKRKRMTGKMMSNIEFSEMYEKQMRNQKLMLSKGMYPGEESISTLPVDSKSLSSYHTLQLMSEIGEVLDADKRWKNFRNEKYDKEAKAEEIADCFIVMMNIAMYSGLSSEELVKAIDKKIDKVYARIMSKE